MELPFDLDLLDRYLSGTCSPHERHEVEQWIRRNPRHSIAAIKDAGSSYPLGLGDSSAAVGRVRERIHPVRHTKGGSVAQRSPSGNSKMPSRALRSLGFGLVITACLVTFGIFASRPGTAPSIREFSTTVGQRSTLQLPDGSTALLAPGTRVRYPSSFGKTSRTIELTGQALFTITHASGTPFIVRTAEADTRVLGTSFAVRQYDADTATHVIVAEGKVSVSNHFGGLSEIVTTGQELRATSRRLSWVRQVQDIGAALAWTQGRLEFTDVPLKDIIADLKRMYTLDIQIASPALAQQRVTGAIHQSMTPDGAVQILALALGVRVEHKGTTFYLSE